MLCKGRGGGYCNHWIMYRIHGESAVWDMGGGLDAVGKVLRALGQRERTMIDEANKLLWAQ